MREAGTRRPQRLACAGNGVHAVCRYSLRAHPLPPITPLWHAQEEELRRLQVERQERERLMLAEISKLRTLYVVSQLEPLPLLHVAGIDLRADAAPGHKWNA